MLLWSYVFEIKHDCYFIRESMQKLKLSTSCMHHSGAKCIINFEYCIWS